jgi:hypothetical protein
MDLRRQAAPPPFPGPEGGQASPRRGAGGMSRVNVEPGVGCSRHLLT